MSRHLSISSMASVLLMALLAGGSIGKPAAAEPATDRISAPSDFPYDSTGLRGPSRIEIRGFVSDANGGPVRGATIRLMSESDTVKTRSDATGRFHARVTATKGVRVLVQAYGYRDLVRSYRASRPVIQAALALLPPYPLGWVTVTMADPPARRTHRTELSG